jgi:hypothetical protein
METRIEKSKHTGWKAKTVLELPGEYGRGKMELTISTYARNGAIVTGASVGFVQDGFVHHYLHQDFNRQVMASPCARVTEKAISTQHKQALGDLESIKAEAMTQYTPIVEA